MKKNYLCITMKSFPRIILIVLFVFTSLFMQECRRCKGGNSYSHFKIVGFTLSNIWKFSINKMEYLNANDINMQNNDTLWLNLMDSSIQVASIQNIKNYELMACDISHTIDYTNNWDSINIRTLDDFDNLHLAGSSINNVCILSPYTYYNPNGKFYSPSFFSIMKNEMPFNKFSLGLLKKPTNNAVRIQFCFYNTKTNDSTMSISPILRFR